MGAAPESVIVGSHRSSDPTTEGHWGRLVACLRRLAKAMLATNLYRLSATNFAS